jgi:hypothetical protein
LVFLFSLEYFLATFLQGSIRHSVGRIGERIH